MWIQCLAYNTIALLLLGSLLVFIVRPMLTRPPNTTRVLWNMYACFGRGLVTWLAGFGAQIKCEICDVCSGAGAGASAAGPSCNLIGWTVWCFGAGGKKNCPKRNTKYSYCHFFEKKRCWSLCCWERSWERLWWLTCYKERDVLLYYAVGNWALGLVNRVRPR